MLSVKISSKCQSFFSSSSSGKRHHHDDKIDEGGGSDSGKKLKNQVKKAFLKAYTSRKYTTPSF